MNANRFTLKFGHRGITIYRTADRAPWFIWNRYPGVTIGLGVRVAPRHMLSLVWRKA